MTNPTAETDAKLCTVRIGQRWADALRARYPVHTVKRIMADFDAAEGTVKAWLAGQPPQQRHIASAYNIHGPAMICEVYLADRDLQLRATVLRELDAAEARLSATLAKLREEVA